MAEGCSDCLASELGFLDEALYPLTTEFDEPTRIYCKNGVPVIPPLKGCTVITGGSQWGGFGLGISVVTAVTVTASNEQILTWTNDSDYDAQALILVNGTLAQISGGTTDNVSYTTGFQLAVSSPAVSAEFVRSFSPACGITAGVITSHALTNSYAVDIDPGATLSITPILRYSVGGGGGAGSTMAYAFMNVVAMAGHP